MITSLFQLYCKFRRFTLLVLKKVISMNYGCSRSCWKPWTWVRLDLIFTTRDKYFNSNLNLPTKFTSSSRTTEFKDIFSWNISQIITRTVPISTRIVIRYAMKQAIPFEFGEKSMEIEITTWSKFTNGEKAIAEQILASEEWNKSSEERNKSKRAGLSESQSRIRVGKLTTWVRSFEIEKL